MSDAKKMLKELAYTHLEPMDEQGRELVAVVRCKDCKHWLKDFAGSTEFVGRCEYANYAIGANGYCVYAERKGNAETD